MNEQLGYLIRATDGDLGSVADFLFDDTKWVVRYVVVDTGNWLLGRKVILSPTVVGQPEWRAQVMPVSLTQDQVRNSPDVDTAMPITRETEVRISDYFGWPQYWAGAGDPALSMAGAAGAAPVVETVQLGEAAPAMENAGPRLRSFKDATGYAVESTDGEIGMVDDAILDDESLAIRYVVVKARNWLTGKKVLLSVDWMGEVDTAGRTVRVEVSRERVKESPEFDPAAPVNRAYEMRLYDYYGRPAYWK